MKISASSHSVAKSRVLPTERNDCKWSWVDRTDRAGRAMATCMQDVENAVQNGPIIPTLWTTPLLGQMAPDRGPFFIAQIKSRHDTPVFDR